MKEETRRRKRSEVRSEAEIVKQFRDDLGEKIGDEATLDLIDRLMHVERLEYGFCEQCNTQTRVRYPDYKAALQGLRLVLEYYIGKPVQRVEETKEIKGRIELVALQNASIEELRAIAAEPEIEAGDSP